MDSERSIEKLLRACAGKRRDEARLPAELHPATRRMLQGEVLRQFGDRQAQQRSAGWWSALIHWPRLAWAGTVAAVVILSAVFIGPLRPAKNDLMARNEQALTAASELSREAADPTRRASTEELSPRLNEPQENAADKSKLLREFLPQVAASQPAPVAADSATELRDAAKPAEPSAPASPPVPSRGMLAGAALAPTSAAPTSYGLPAGEVEQDTTGGIPAQASVRREVATTATSADERLRMAKDENAPEAPVGEGAFFYDVVRSQARGSPAPTLSRMKASLADSPSSASSVLVSFKLEERGNQVQVIDHDGSVYIGTRQPLPAALGTVTGSFGGRLGDAATQSRSMGFRTAQTEQQFSESQKQPAGYFFQVTGTNKSLKQKVVFTGSLLPVTNSMGQVESPNAPAGLSGNLDRTLLLNSRVSGKAVINDRQQVDVNAAPAAK